MSAKNPPYPTANLSRPCTRKLSRAIASILSPASPLILSLSKDESEAPTSADSRK